MRHSKFSTMNTVCDDCGIIILSFLTSLERFCIKRLNKLFLKWCTNVAAWKIADFDSLTNSFLVTNVHIPEAPSSWAHVVYKVLQNKPKYLIITRGQILIENAISSDYGCGKCVLFFFSLFLCAKSMTK